MESCDILGMAAAASQPQATGTAGGVPAQSDRGGSSSFGGCGRCGGRPSGRGWRVLEGSPPMARGLDQLGRAGGRSATVVISAMPLPRLGRDRCALLGRARRRPAGAAAVQTRCRPRPRDPPSSCMAPGCESEAPDHRRRVALCAGGHQERELVAADPREYVLGAQYFAPATRGVDQQRVSLGVTSLVVDVLEVVDVDHGQAERLAAPARVREAAVELKLPRSSVGQAGQRVGVSHAVQLVQQPVAL